MSQYKTAWSLQVLYWSPVFIKRDNLEQSVLSRETTQGNRPGLRPTDLQNELKQRQANTQLQILSQLSSEKVELGMWE